jgi:hypothetical protein
MFKQAVQTAKAPVRFTARVQGGATSDHAPALH